MQFLCFAIEIEGLLGKLRLGSGDQAEKISSLFRYFNATADRAAEILFGNALVCFGVICANAGAASNQLLNQSIVRGIVRHCFRESDNGLAKSRSPFLQIDRMLRRPVVWRCLI